MSSPSLPTKMSSQTLLTAGVVYSILLAIAGWKHTLWRDEAQAWLISRDSHSLASVVHNVRYEGTPPLWHFVLYFISRFTLNPEWMKLPNLLFSIATAALILSASRVSVWVRIGFLFSYFLLFEYAVINRDYMIGIMLLISTLTLFNKDEAKVKISIALSLAALTSLPALVVSVCLYPFHLVSGIAPSDLRQPGRWLAALGAARTLALTLFALCVVASLAVIHPPDGAGAFLGHGQWIRLLRVFKFSSITEAYLPVPDRLYFWNRSFFSHLGRFTSTLLGIALSGALCFWFRRKQARCFFIIASSLLMAEMAVARMFAMRHIGWLFIVFLLAVLLENDDSLPASPPHEFRKSIWRPAFLAGILCVQAATGVFAVAVSTHYPFSPSKQVVLFLQQEHLDRSPLIFWPDYAGGAVLAYLQRPYAYSIERHAASSFVLWDKIEYQAYSIPTRQDLAAAAVHGMRPVVITEGPLSPEQASALGIKFVASFSGGLNASDHYFVYK
jgi:hypothetical protein